MPNKRWNSEGTIRKRSDGRWEARYVAADGERKSLYRKTRQEAARALAQALADREQGIIALDGRQTVRDYLTEWMRSEMYRVKYGSVIRYEQAVRLHLIPGLGHIVLSKLTAQQISAYYGRALAGGATSASVYYTHRVLHAALEDALRLDLVHRNVAHLVDPPRKPKRQMAVYNEEQARALVRASIGNRFEALCLLVLATGMREGELLALTWDDIDLERARVTTLMTLQRYPGKHLVREEVKTAHSARVIALSKVVLAALRAHRVRQEEERGRLGEAWVDLNLVFPNRTGGLSDPSHFRRSWWGRLVKKAGLPYIRFHDMRHTAATLLLAHGMPIKAVSEMLGHASVSITLNLYGHVLPHMQQQLADEMDSIIGVTVEEREDE